MTQTKVARAEALEVEIQKHKPLDLERVEPESIHGHTEATALIRMAIEKGLPVETMERLFALHEKLLERQAATEFAQAKADFQAECPPIKKTSHKAARDGGPAYDYAELDEIVRTVQPLLHRRGFSYSWDMPEDPGTTGFIKCVCTLSHVNGHKESARFVCPTQTRAGMSEQQKYAAALTYARRYALIQVLGLSTTDEDPDGVIGHPYQEQAPPPAGNGKRQGGLSEDQVKEVENLCQQAGKTPAQLLGLFPGVKRIEDLSYPKGYERAVGRLHATITAKVLRQPGEEK